MLADAKLAARRMELCYASPRQNSPPSCFDDILVLRYDLGTEGPDTALKTSDDKDIM